MPYPNHEEGSRVTQSAQTGLVMHTALFSVARVRPRTSKGITDLLLLNLV